MIPLFLQCQMYPRVVRMLSLLRRAACRGTRARRMEWWSPSLCTHEQRNTNAKRINEPNDQHIDTRTRHKELQFNNIVENADGYLVSFGFYSRRCCCCHTARPFAFWVCAHRWTRYSEHIKNHCHRHGECMRRCCCCCCWLAAFMRTSGCVVETNETDDGSKRMCQRERTDIVAERETKKEANKRTTMLLENIFFGRVRVAHACMCVGARICLPFVWVSVLVWVSERASEWASERQFSIYSDEHRTVVTSGAQTQAFSRSFEGPTQIQSFSFLFVCLPNAPHTHHSVHHRIKRNGKYVHSQQRTVEGERRDM